MPRKNRKKQRKEDRKRAIQRVRQEKGWQPPPEIEFPDDELTRDLLAFVPELGGNQGGDEASEALTDAVLGSHDLVDEPEFREFYFHPMQAIDLYGDLEEEQGVSEEMLNSLSEEEEDELFFDLMIEIARGMLTQEMQADILGAVDAAWQRVRREGNVEKAGRLAAMLALLGSEAGEELWPVAGLVQAILRRSLDAGFEMLGVIESAEAASMSPRALFQPGTEEGFQQQIAAIMDKYPGLAAVMAQEDQEVWEEGIQALTEGDLYVGFFSDEELERAAETLTPEGLGAPDLAGEELGRAGMQAIQAYIAGLLTPKRRAEMREQLLTMVEDEGLAGDWYPFLMAMLEDLDDDDPETALTFLTAAVIGEMEDAAEPEDGDQAQG